MRRLLLGFLAAVLMSAASSAHAADLAYPDKVRVHSSHADCVRWVEQTQSWYNYCEPVRYPPRTYDHGAPVWH
jgi:hypothetical protein